MAQSSEPAPDQPQPGGGSEAARLRAAHAEIAQLAGGLAHEVRNPLSTMRMNLDLLAEDLAGQTTQRDRRILQKIDRVRKECHRLQGILDDFLRFVRVQEIQAAPVNLNDLVEDLRDFCEGQGASQGIVSRLSLDQNLPPVPLDENLFKQAVLNLVLNAQHAMPDGGELILRTRREGDTVVLDVIDTGVGMSPEQQARAFDAFYSSRPGGSGLGLPTTRRIVEAHGGIITVESAPGVGSKFTIRLPLGGRNP